jgi:hypothetical protein
MASAAVIQVLVQAFLAAYLRDAILASQSLQYAADFVFRTEMKTGAALDVTDGLLNRFPAVLFLSHLRSFPSPR